MTDSKELVIVTILQLNTKLVQIVSVVAFTIVICIAALTLGREVDETKFHG